MIRDIKELDDIGHRLRVTWAKANNFYGTFAHSYLEVCKRLEKGEYGSDWTTARWTVLKVGVFQETVIAILKAHQRALANEQRQTIAEAEAAQRQAKAAERAETAARNAAKKAAVAAAKATAAEPDIVRKIKVYLKREKVDGEVISGLDTLLTEPQTKQQAKRKTRRGGGRHAQPTKPVKPRPEDAEAAAWIEASERALTLGRVEAGEYYLKLREKVKAKQAGKDPRTNQAWGWKAYVEQYVPRSLRDVNRCIKEFRTSCPDSSQTDTVIKFPNKTTGYR